MNKLWLFFYSLNSSGIIVSPDINWSRHRHFLDWQNDMRYHSLKNNNPLLNIVSLFTTVVKVTDEEHNIDANTIFRGDKETSQVLCPLKKSKKKGENGSTAHHYSSTNEKNIKRKKKKEKEKHSISLFIPQRKAKQSWTAKPQHTQRSPERWFSGPLTQRRRYSTHDGALPMTSPPPMPATPPVWYHRRLDEEAPVLIVIIGDSSLASL